MSPDVYHLVNTMCRFIVSVSYPPCRLTGEGKETCPETRVVDPGLRNPTAIFTIGVKRISEVTETMLGPAVFVIVNALLKKGGIAVFIA
jgi:hypothetical protein